MIILNKNIHFNLTLFLFGSWLTGLLAIIVVQDTVSLAHDQIYKKDTLNSNNSLPKQSSTKSISGQQLPKQKLSLESQLGQDVASSDTPNLKTKPKTVTKADFYIPEQKTASKPQVPVDAKIVLPQVTTKIVAKSNAEVFSAKTLDLIREFEGFRSRAYRDTDGTPVIGYGLSRVRGRRVRMGDRISVHHAETALKAEVKAIQTKIKSIVKVELNSHQLGALTSFAFNTGFYNLKRSTLLRKLNTGDYHGAANELLRWNKAHSGGRLVPMAGLMRRRRAERKLFLTSPLGKAEGLVIGKKHN